MKLDPKLREALRALGRIGGRKGGKLRMAKLTAEERRALALKAARARWKQPKEKTQS